MLNAYLKALFSKFTLTPLDDRDLDVTSVILLHGAVDSDDQAGWVGKAFLPQDPYAC